MALVAAVLIGCYLLGSIPFPVIVSRLVKGVDLRRHGSGNMGALNSARVLGKRWFPVVFGLDFAKGAVAVTVARALLPGAVAIDPIVAGALGGLFAVIGHCFPIFAGFKGGVGLAATAGAFALISPGLLITALAAIGLGWALLRNMSVGVAATALIAPAMAWYWLGTPAAIAVLTAWGALVFGLHWDDVGRWLAARRS